MRLPRPSHIKAANIFFFINVNSNKTQQDATRLKYIVLHSRQTLSCRVCRSQDSVEQQRQKWSRVSFDSPQRKSSAHFVPLHPVTSSHYHHCITNHFALIRAGSSCSHFPLYPRGAVGTSVGKREAAVGIASMSAQLQQQLWPTNYCQ